jgi:O-antigen/teichoic acid export membrane protein
MQPANEQKDLLKGMVILTAAAIITKILSAVYRIPFQNMVGDVGFYIYQQVYPFYGLAVVLSTNGFPVIISKLYAEKNKNEARGMMVIAFLFLYVFGLAAFAAMYFGSDWLAIKMDDPRLAVLFRVISIIFLVLPITSLFRGYFQGKGDMLPTAVSQVAEQFIRVLFILFLAALFMREGYSLYVVGAGAAFASIAGGIAAGIILIFFLKKRGEIGVIPIGTKLGSICKKDIAEIVNALIFQGFAVCISGMLLIFIQLGDSINLYSQLVSSGIDEISAKQLKGIYDRGQPLVQLGTVIATSMSLSLVPLISSGKMKKNKILLMGHIQTALKVAIMIGAGGTAGLMCIIRPTNRMLFENDQGSSILAILWLLILFSSLSITISGILQGLGATVFPALVILVGFSIKCLLNLPLVFKWGTQGAAISSVAAMLFISIALSIKLKRIVWEELLPKGYIRTILFSVFIMSFCLLAYVHATDFFFANGRLFSSFQALSAVVIGGGIYLFIIIKSGIFKEQELAMLPFGNKLIALLPHQRR